MAYYPSMGLLGGNYPYSIPSYPYSTPSGMVSGGLNYPTPSGMVGGGPYMNIPAKAGTAAGAGAAGAGLLGGGVGGGMSMALAAILPVLLQELFKQPQKITAPAVSLGSKPTIQTPNVYANRLMPFSSAYR